MKEQSQEILKKYFSPINFEKTLEEFDHVKEVEEVRYFRKNVLKFTRKDDSVYYMFNQVKFDMYGDNPQEFCGRVWNSLKEFLTYYETVSLISIGFCQPKFYKRHIWLKAKKVMEKLIAETNYVIHCDYGWGKGKYSTSDKLDNMISGMDEQVKFLTKTYLEIK